MRVIIFAYPALKTSKPVLRFSTTAFALGILRAVQRMRVYDHTDFLAEYGVVGRAVVAAPQPAAQAESMAWYRAVSERLLELAGAALANATNW